MIDLHLHLDGSLTQFEIYFLAKEQGVALPADTPQGLAAYLTAPKDCGSLNRYLKCFDLPISVLQTRPAMLYAVSSLIYRLHGQGILYAEIRFAPQFHTKNGLSQEEVLQAALEGVEKSKKHMSAEMGIGLILCMMRGEGNEEENLETLRLAEKYLGQGVCAVDLAGAEGLYPTKNFDGLFQKAREKRVPFTIHAGEADGPDSIRTALSFGAQRIGHGVRSIEDYSLLLELAQDSVVLELCPSSNLQTHAVEDIEHFPVKTFLSMGIPVTINTDNMTVSDTTVDKEFKLIESKCGVTAEEKRRMYINAVNAAFLPPEEKRKLSWRISRRLNLT